VGIWWNVIFATAAPQKEGIKMDILKAAHEITSAIYKMTGAIVLTGNKAEEEAEIEAYANLMEKREPLVNKLIELKKGIDSAMESSPEFAVIKQTITDITDLDKAHLATVENMYKTVQTSHKEVKAGQRIHNAYVDLQPESTSRRFDTKQ
jgi:hypothetical protein